MNRGNGERKEEDFFFFFFLVYLKINKPGLLTQGNKMSAS